MLSNNTLEQIEVLITAAMVKELKDLSGDTLSICKRALIQTNGNIELSQQLLRNKMIR